MTVSSTNVKVGDGSSSVLGHFGENNRQIEVGADRFFRDLAFKPYFSGNLQSGTSAISFSDFAGVRGAMNHSLGTISLTTSEGRKDGSYAAQTAVQYQSQDISGPNAGRGDRIVCLLYDTNDGSPGACAVNSYFITTSSGSATLELDWDIQSVPSGGNAFVIVRSYKYGYINGPWINNGIYEGNTAISGLSCNMDVSYPNTIINIGIWGPGNSTAGVGVANIYRARLR